MAKLPRISKLRSAAISPERDANLRVWQNDSAPVVIDDRSP